MITEKMELNMSLGSAVDLCNHRVWIGSKSGQIGSVQFSCSVVFNFATPWTAACQASLSITNPPRAYSNSNPLSQWCHPHISSSVIPFFSCLQSFQASGSFPMSQFFASGGQSIGASASASVLPMNREWQTTPIFLPWEPHEQYEKKTYRLPKSTWKDAQHC